MQISSPLRIGGLSSPVKRPRLAGYSPGYDPGVLRAVVFDFNGVLVDDEPIHFRVMQRALEPEGITVHAAAYYSRLLGLDDRSSFAAVLSEAGERPEPSRIMRLVARKAAYYREAIHQEGYPFSPGAVALVRSASSAGLTLALVSGALRDEVEGALCQEGLRGFFKAVITSEDVAEGKPDPEGYQRALTELNALPPLPERLFHPHEVLAIEDSPAGLRAAKGAGFTTLGVAQAYSARMLGEADFTVANLHGLTPAQLERRFSEVSRS
jgi:HAD superfamily hydrolase (TIGR01509 family)